MSEIEVSGLGLEREGFRLGPIDLKVAAGTATVILGPSGAGKTTLLRALAGFLPLGAGRLSVDGEPVETLPPERRRFGFVPPSLGLLPHRRVDRNVSYALDLAGDAGAASEARRWMERFGLLRLARKYPAQLSSGERQRVAMARALTARPRFLLWDEPLSALDVDSRDTLLRLLRDLIEEEGLPLLLVTHDPTTAFALASRVVVLEGGRIRSDTAPEELAGGLLDRFVARFLGYENLFSREELATAPEGSFASQLLRASGPGGVVVPSEAFRWSRPDATTGAHAAEVRAVRWTAAGWVVALRQGSLTLHATPTREVPSVRAGERVRVEIDLDAVRPLMELGGAGT